MPDMPPSSKLRRLYQNYFYAFGCRSFLELHDGTKHPFQPNWHLELLAAKLEAVRKGLITRLIIELPPRSLKSEFASVAFPAYLLGHNPAEQIMSVGYSQEFIENSARRCRALMQTPFYKGTFDTRLAHDRMAVNDFATTAGGFRLSTSIGGVLTGRGADTIIIDDPHKADEIMSELRRLGVLDWYDNSLYSRLNNKVKGAIIIVMQRLHEMDLVGHVLTQEGWDVLSLPSMALVDEEHQIDTPFGPRTFRRSKGGLLHPEREPLHILDRQRKTMGRAAFMAQYQQAPAPEEGNWVQPEWFQRFTQATRPETFDQIVLSVDSANKVSETADYTVITAWGIADGHYYLLHVVRQQVEFHELLNLVEDTARQYKVDDILVEDRASGIQLIQELKRKGEWNVMPCQPVGDKVMRFAGQASLIRAGFVHVPADAPWVDAFIRELTAFPGSSYADQVDSTSQFLAWVRDPTSTRGLLGYYKQQLAKAKLQKRQREDATVRVRAPEGVPAIRTLTGKDYVVPTDRIVTMSEEDAEPLLRQGWEEVQ